MPVGVTLLLEGEEENGSINLPEFVKANAAELKADLALVCDTGMWDRKTPAITTSLRGLLYEEVIIRAADRDLHSGLFGGAAANPIHILARIVASLHKANGKVAVPGFYAGVKNLPKAVKERLAGLGLTEKDFLSTVGLKHTIGEKDRLLIEQISTRPTCDVNGIWGGYTGEGTKTVIAGEARAKISFRLVGEQDPKAIQKAFRAYVKAQVPKDCSVEFIGYKGSRALQLPWDSAALKAAEKAMKQEWARHPPWSAPAVPSPSWVISSVFSAWIHCSSDSGSTMTGCIRPMRNTTSHRSTRAPAAGRGFWRRCRRAD